MVKFTLSRALAKVVQETVETETGEIIPVDADFRTVLKCMRVLSDVNIRDADKCYLLSVWFFKGQLVGNPIGLFAGFCSDGDDDEPPDERVLDFEQDADAIYSSFMQQYGIDLLDVPYLHWAKFQALMGGLGDDTAVGRRIAIRTMDTSKLTGKDRAKADRLKRRVALAAVALTAEEEELQRRIDQALSEGRDPAPEIRELNEYYNRKGGGENG